MARLSWIVSANLTMFSDSLNIESQGRRYTETSSTMGPINRVVSLDQFRGFCVAGMFVVNFLGPITATHRLLKHNNSHFSLADMIMPSFILICGFSYRMTFIKRSASQSSSEVKRRYLWRSLGLILLSLMFFGLGGKLASYSDLSVASLAKMLTELIKANLWEVLAIIGACQIVLLPFISLPAKHRVATLVAFSVGHVILSGWFNWNFVYGLPNGLDELLGTTGKRAWDGGFFGLLSWSTIMLLGTLLPDLTAKINTNRNTVVALLMVGMLLMLLGYSLSCLTRLYDKPIETPTASSEPVTTEGPKDQFDSLVWPNWNQAQGRSWLSLLAEPPLVPPPGKDIREPNYWAMDKRIVSQSFVFFSGGLAVLLYGLFVAACDIGGLAISAFTTFGQNPLAAYLIHHVVEKNLYAIFPKDSSGLWAAVGVVASISVTYLFVRFLEVRGLFLRL